MADSVRWLSQSDCSISISIRVESAILEALDISFNASLEPLVLL